VAGSNHRIPIGFEKAIQGLAAEIKGWG